MKPSIRIGKIAGVEIGIHYSWFAVVALVSWSLAEELLPNRSPGWATGMYWATGTVSALLLFASVLVHELAHSLVAKARGISVQGITLFLLGGVSNVQADAMRARDEFVISAVGPLSSFMLALVFWLLLASLPDKDTPLAVVIWYLAVVNLLIGTFNLLPGFPLDGGRVLRSVVWAMTGSLAKATRVASLGGRILGVVLMALGAIQVAGGNFLGGVWIVFIGWFLHSAAGLSHRGMSLQTNVRKVRVKEVMDTDPITIGPEMALSDAVYEHFLRQGAHSLLVCEDDRLLGIITPTDIRNVPRHLWTSVKVRDEMTPIPLWHVGPDDDLLHAMGLLGEHSIHQAPVLEGDRLVGLFSRAHVVRYLHSHRGPDF